MRIIKFSLCRQAPPDESPQDPAPGDPRDAAAQAPPPRPEAQEGAEAKGRCRRLCPPPGTEGEGGQREEGRGGQEEAVGLTAGVTVLRRGKGLRQ